MKTCSAARGSRALVVQLQPRRAERTSTGAEETKPAAQADTSERAYCARRSGGLLGSRMDDGYGGRPREATPRRPKAGCGPVERRVGPFAAEPDGLWSGARWAGFYRWLVRRKHQHMRGGKSPQNKRACKAGPAEGYVTYAILCRQLGKKPNGSGAT